MGRQHCSIDTSNLIIGQEFKNLQELSLFVLNEKLPPGQGRTNRINYMKEYFSWNKVPNSQKIIISEIYPQRRKKLPKTAKYAPLIFDILSSLPGEISMSNTDLICALGIFNDNFDPKKKAENINKLGVNFTVFNIINSDIYTKVSSIISTSLSQLEKYNYLVKEEVYDVIYKTPNTPKIDKEIIDGVYRETQEEFSCNNDFEIKKKGKVREYHIRCSSKLSYLGISKVTKRKRIRLLVKSDNAPDKNALRELIVESLLKGFQNNPIAKKIVKYYVS